MSSAKPSNGLWSRRRRRVVAREKVRKYSPHLARLARRARLMSRSPRPEPVQNLIDRLLAKAGVADQPEDREDGLVWVPDEELEVDTP